MTAQRFIAGVRVTLALSCGHEVTMPWAQAPAVDEMLYPSVDEMLYPCPVCPDNTDETHD